jgi:hypothetical protein
VATFRTDRLWSENCATSPVHPQRTGIPPLIEELPGDDRQPIAQSAVMSSTIPKQFSITRHGRSYRGTYSMSNEIVTVRHTAADGVIRKMSAPTNGLKAITVARSILTELA